MSRETMTTLNLSTLIGFAAKRGHAWHYRQELQGEESNHYDGAIPVGDVMRRLFNYTAQARPVFVALPTDLLTADAIADDGTPIRYVRVNDRQAITHSETGDVFGLFSDGYAIHQFEEWLIDAVSPLASGTITIGSAGPSPPDLPGCCAGARSPGSRWRHLRTSEPVRVSSLGPICLPRPAMTAAWPPPTRWSPPTSCATTR